MPEHWDELRMGSVAIVNSLIALCGQLSGRGYIYELQLHLKSYLTPVAVGTH